MKVAIITCYFFPDYVRSQSLRAALAHLPDVEPVIVKNRHTGMLRYPEVLYKLWQLRRKERPDVYLLCFRGQEILPTVLWLAHGKPVIFDEFIVPLAWSKQEKHRLTPTVAIYKFLSRLSAPLYKRWLKACTAILTDTSAHAALSAELSGVSVENYHVLPVGTDEAVFYPAPLTAAKSRPFTVSFYGFKLTPLHGFSYILEAAQQVYNKYPEIQFILDGGEAYEAHLPEVQQAIQAGANIIFNPRQPIEVLRDHMWQADMVLGGPFGPTPQAQHVVTGKTYQALACHRAVVIGQNTAAQDFIDRKNCLMVPLGDAGALAEAILWGYEHPKQLAHIAHAGRQLYEAKYSDKVIAGQLQQILQSLS